MDAADAAARGAEVRDARAAGVRAYKANTSASECPFEEDHEREAWLDGWSSARDHEARELAR